MLAATTPGVCNALSATAAAKSDGRVIAVTAKRSLATNIAVGASGRVVQKESVWSGRSDWTNVAIATIPTSTMMRGSHVTLTSDIVSVIVLLDAPTEEIGPNAFRVVNPRAARANAMNNARIDHREYRM